MGGVLQPVGWRSGEELTVKLVSCGREMRSALLKKMASLSSVQSGEKELRGHHRSHRVARVSWGRVGPWSGTKS